MSLRIARRRAHPFQAQAMLVLILGCAIPALAQEADSQLSFDLRIAPGIDGTLDASAALAWRFLPFLQTGANFSARSVLSEWNESGGISTSIRSEKTLDLDLVRLPSGILGFSSGEAGVWLGGGLVANGVVLDEERYGHGSGYLYYQDTRTTWLKPLLAADLSLRLGPAALEFAYRTSWPFTLSEKVTGTGQYSNGALIVPMTIELADEGFETRLSGTGGIAFGGGWALRGHGAWIRHLGHTVSILGGTQTDYVYEATTFEAELSVVMPLRGRRPSLGIGWSSFAFEPVDLYSIQDWSSTRIRLLLGLEF